MDVQTLKDAFFFVGSILGITAFVKTIIDPMIEGNKRKWEEVKNHIQEQDFINLAIEIWQSRRVHEETLGRIRQFIRDIEQGAEYLRFGPVLNKRYNQHLQNLRALYSQLRNLIQVPYWEPVTYEDEEGGKLECWQFNKQFFLKENLHGRAYVEHLDAAAELAEKMRLEFRQLSVLSSLHLVEIPFARKIIAKRAAIPVKSVSDAESPNNSLNRSAS